SISLPPPPELAAVDIEDWKELSDELKAIPSHGNFSEVLIASFVTLLVSDVFFLLALHATPITGVPQYLWTTGYILLGASFVGTCLSAVNYLRQRPTIEGSKGRASGKMEAMEKKFRRPPQLNK